MTVLTSGDDTYTSTTPGEAVFGLDGNDTITASSGGNQLSGGNGNDTLLGGAGDDTLIGDDSTNTTYHNTMKGLGGDDRITSFSFYDSIAGGKGNDDVTVWAMTTGQVVDGGQDTDRIEIYALAGQTAPVHLTMGSTFIPVVGGINGATYTNFETLTFVGGTGANTIEGAAGDDWIAADLGSVASFDAGSLKGQGGDDHLEFNGLPNGGSGIEAIDGGDGNDTLFWTPGTHSGIGDLTIDGHHGTMKAGTAKFASFKAVESLNITTFSGQVGTLTFTGTDGADKLSLYATASNVTSGLGDDQVVINGGTTSVDGGNGNDTISVAFADSSLNTLHGGDGNDGVYGGSGQSNLYGDDGDDHVSSSNGKSSLYGGSGDDTLYTTSSYANTGTGSATIDGGTGRDVLSIELSLYGAAFTADFSSANVTLADGTHILRCEAITFVASSGNDVLTSSNDAGGYLVNKLLSLAGNDTLTASSHGATLDGGFGDDLLIAGAGADKLIGNSNTAAGDTVSYANSGNGVTVDLNLLTAQGGAGYAAGDILSGVENLIGSAKNDQLTGDTHANTLRGGSGNDNLIGGLGKDVLTGNAGDDTFTYGGAGDSSGIGFDSITDFDAKADVFHVTAAVTGIDNEIAHGTLTAASFDSDLGGVLTGKLHKAHAILFTPDGGDAAYVGHTFLIVDQNGAAGYQSGFDLVIDITGGHNLTHLGIADFTT